MLGKVGILLLQVLLICRDWFLDLPACHFSSHGERQFENKTTRGKTKETPTKSWGHSFEFLLSALSEAGKIYSGLFSETNTFPLFGDMLGVEFLLLSSKKFQTSTSSETSNYKGEKTTLQTNEIKLAYQLFESRRNLSPPVLNTVLVILTSMLVIASFVAFQFSFL